MGLFDFLKGADINAEVEEFNSNSNAVLVDVRETDEYRQGHIPRSVNVPLSKVNKITSVVTDKDKELYVYCLSGSRSSRAVAAIKQLGYSNVKNIGGISSYKGRVER